MPIHGNTLDLYRNIRSNPLVHILWPHLVDPPNYLHTNYRVRSTIYTQIIESDRLGGLTLTSSAHVPLTLPVVYFTGSNGLKHEKKSIRNFVILTEMSFCFSSFSQDKSRCALSCWLGHNPSLSLPPWIVLMSYFNVRIIYVPPPLQLCNGPEELCCDTSGRYNGLWPAHFSEMLPIKNKTCDWTVNTEINIFIIGVKIQMFEILQ